MLNHRGQLVNIISYNKRTLKMSRKGQAFCSRNIKTLCGVCCLCAMQPVCVCTAVSSISLCPLRIGADFHRGSTFTQPCNDDLIRVNTTAVTPPLMQMTQLCSPSLWCNNIPAGLYIISWSIRILFAFSNLRNLRAAQTIQRYSTTKIYTDSCHRLY